MGYYGYYWDPTYILVLIGAAVSLLASARVKSTFNRYSKVRSMSGRTGAQTAEEIAYRCHLGQVRVQHVAGSLTDHYDPRDKTVNLSDSVYGSTSVAAIAVAAHECGHAVQDQKDYVPLRMRHALVPVANLGSTAAWPLILIGLFLNGSTGTLVMNIGVWAFTLAVLFQLVTLPVEFNASRRALAIIRDTGMVTGDELRMARSVLTAAGRTTQPGTIKTANKHK